MKLQTWVLVIVAVLASSGGCADAASSRQDPQVTLPAGEEALRAENFADAVRQLERAIVADPRNPKGYLLLGRSHRALGNHGKALKYFRITLELEPSNLAALAGRGQAYLGTGELAQAEKVLQRLALKCDYKCPEYKQLERAIVEHKVEGERRAAQ